MPQLSKMILIHTTADKDDANTDADFVLEIQKLPFPVVKGLDLPDVDERERGRTDTYVLDVLADNINNEAAEFAVRMRMTSTTDGWLPQSLFLLGETTSGDTVVLGAHPEWPIDGWFDRGDDAFPDTYVIAN